MYLWKNRSLRMVPSSRKILELNEQAKELNLKVGVGLMCRHSQARRELKSE